MVLVDTTIWSLALWRRRRDLNPEEQHLVREWVLLVKAGRAALIGPVRQEVLSGIRHESDFVSLQQQLSAFGYLDIQPGDYDQAASFFNTCRAKGVVGTPIDMLIGAVARRASVPIFTTGPDFPRYARLLPIHLYEPGVAESSFE
jgi:predicted nucleic acid-binding protein